MRVQKVELPLTGYGSKAATLTAYVQDNVEAQAARRRPGVLICPGGGYAFCSDLEAEPIALALVARGLQAFVLDYTVLDDAESIPLLPAPQVDLARALALVRSRADEWRVDEEDFGVLGCSAGAHLCASYAGVMRDEAFLARAGVSADTARPNWQVLCYPVIDLDAGWPPDPAYAARICDAGSPLRHAPDLVGPDTPQTFLWHTATDETVPVRNAYLYAEALAAHGVDHECHVFHAGRHGLSLATEQSARWDDCVNPHVAHWLDLMLEWLGATDACSYLDNAPSEG